MFLKNHNLVTITASNIESWMPQDERRMRVLRLSLYEQPEYLSPFQRYELVSYYWCQIMLGVFNRLNLIRDITSHYLRRRAKEEKGNFLKEWLIYNYQWYFLIYQSVLDVSLQLTDELIILNIPLMKCTFKQVCNNSEIKSKHIDLILKDIQSKTKQHHEYKNLLVHQGQGTRPPVSLLEGKEKEKFIQILEMQEFPSFEEFYAVKITKPEMLKLMLKETTDIELEVSRLFDAILPMYIDTINSFRQ